MGTLVAGQHKDRGGVRIGLGHAGEGVFNAWTGLYHANTVVMTVGNPAVAVGHVYRRPLHSRNYRVGARSGSSVNEGVVGETKGCVNTFLFQDVSYGSLTLHWTLLLL
jgi:hypothetical protein